MSIRLSEARRCFGEPGYQLATEAVAALALHLDAEGTAIAEAVLRSVDDENEHRRLQGLPPRRRIDACDIKRAIRRVGAAEGLMSQ